jgi:hypothetical protein
VKAERLRVISRPLPVLSAIKPSDYGHLRGDWRTGEDSTIPQPANGLHGPQGVIRGRAGEGGWMGGGYLHSRAQPFAMTPAPSMLYYPKRPTDMNHVARLSG